MKTTRNATQEEIKQIAELWNEKQRLCAFLDRMSDALPMAAAYRSRIKRIDEELIKLGVNKESLE